MGIESPIIPFCQSDKSTARPPRFGASSSHTHSKTPRPQEPSQGTCPAQSRTWTANFSSSQTRAQPVRASRRPHPAPTNRVIPGPSRRGHGAAAPRLRRQPPRRPRRSCPLGSTSFRNKSDITQWSSSVSTPTFGFSFHLPAGRYRPQC